LVSLSFICLIFGNIFFTLNIKFDGLSAVPSLSATGYDKYISSSAVDPFGYCFVRRVQR
jgi:hypothetical protein